MATNALLDHIAERIRVMLNLPASSREEVRAALLAADTELAIQFGKGGPMKLQGLKIQIEVPIEVDGQLSEDELMKLRKHLRVGIPVYKEQIEHSGIFNQEPRILGALCRFRFGEVRVEVGVVAK